MVRGSEESWVTATQLYIVSGIRRVETTAATFTDPTFCQATIDVHNTCCFGKLAASVIRTEERQHSSQMLRIKLTLMQGFN